MTGSDILVVSGDLIMESEGLRGLTDMHRLNRWIDTALLKTEVWCFVNCDFPVYSILSSMVSRAALTSLLGQGQPMEGVVVPGSKSTKYKRERDLVGLSGDQVMFCKACISLSVSSLLIVISFSSMFLFILLVSFGPLMMCQTCWGFTAQMCLFTAEADVEETVRVPPKVLASHPRYLRILGSQRRRKNIMIMTKTYRITVHSGLQDCHLYIMKRWILDYIVADK